MANDEIRPVIEYLNRYLHDMFIRSGGGSDLLSDLSTEGSLTSTPMISSLSKRLTDLELESNNIAMLSSIIKSIENIERTSTTFDMGLVSSIMGSTFNRRYALLVS